VGRKELATLAHSPSPFVPSFRPLSVVPNASLPAAPPPPTPPSILTTAGQLVNRAARYCHAAARGGQVLVARDLMVRVLASWLHAEPGAITSDCLVEVRAQFDAGQPRTWPWAFMRRDSVGVYVSPADAPPHVLAALPRGSESAGGSTGELSGAGSGGAAAAAAAGGGAGPPLAALPASGPGSPRAAAAGAGAGALDGSALERRLAADAARPVGGALGGRGARDSSVLQWRQQAMLSAAGGSGEGGTITMAGEDVRPVPSPLRAAAEARRPSGSQLPGTPKAGDGGDGGGDAGLAGPRWADGAGGSRVTYVPTGLDAGAAAASDGAAAWGGSLPPQPPRGVPGGGLALPPSRARRPSLLMTLREGSEHLDTLAEAETSGREAGAGGAPALGPPGGAAASSGAPDSGASALVQLSIYGGSDVASDPTAARSRRASGASAEAAAAAAAAAGGAVHVAAGRQQRRPSAARSDGALGGAGGGDSDLSGAGFAGSGGFDSGGPGSGGAATAGGGSGHHSSRRASGLGLTDTDERRSSAGPSVGSAAYSSLGEGGGRRGSRLHGSYLLGEDEANAYTQASLALLGPGASVGPGPSGPPSAAGGAPLPPPLARGGGGGSSGSGQLVPGSLHSSSRLRLVSKRRRQMSYCYDFESSHPGIPAEVADAAVPTYGASLSAAPSGGRRSNTGSDTPSASLFGPPAGGGGFAGGAPAAPSSGAAEAGWAAGGGTAPAGGAAAAAAAAAAAPGDGGASASAGAPSAAGRSSRRNSGVTTGSGATTAEELLHAARLRALPAVTPVPDASTLASLRPLQRRTRTPSARTEDSASAFGGAAIETTLGAIMQRRWLWVRELLVHDLGQFAFKGVAGVHPIVSVTCEELAGRMFPNTIRKGKGEQVAMGRGLLYVVAVRAAGVGWVGWATGREGGVAPPLGGCRGRELDASLVPCLCEASLSKGPGARALTPAAPFHSPAAPAPGRARAPAAHAAAADAAAAGPALAPAAAPAARTRARARVGDRRRQRARQRRGQRRARQRWAGHRADSALVGGCVRGGRRRGGAALCGAARRRLGWQRARVTRAR
jgi:hypothetical protein